MASTSMNKKTLRDQLRGTKGDLDKTELECKELQIQKEKVDMTETLLGQTIAELNYRKKKFVELEDAVNVLTRQLKEQEKAVKLMKEREKLMKEREKESRIEHVAETKKQKRNRRKQADTIKMQLIELEDQKRRLEKTQLSLKHYETLKKKKNIRLANIAKRRVAEAAVAASALEAAAVEQAAAAAALHRAQLGNP